MLVRREVSLGGNGRGSARSRFLRCLAFSEKAPRVTVGFFEVIFSLSLSFFLIPARFSCLFSVALIRRDGRFRNVAAYVRRRSRAELPLFDRESFIISVDSSDDGDGEIDTMWPAPSKRPR